MDIFVIRSVQPVLCMGVAFAVLCVFGSRVCLYAPSCRVCDAFDPLVERLVCWAAPEYVAEPEPSTGTSAVGGFVSVSSVCISGVDGIHCAPWKTFTLVHAEKPLHAEST